MELKVNDRLHGFTVTRIRDIEEFEGRLIEMTHERTGAGLVWAQSSEENKLFSVGFRTLPEDNTGVFHILEHSVLCGSLRFPVREPFVELLKTSMNTFLNAMTYSDKTLYPVSSRIEQDYLNLAEVYLDAVFRPDILRNPSIFYQEGWHIDTEGAEDLSDAVYKGVVFNEMKGAMSDVDQVAERTLGKLLFPDTCYGFNSGGDPDAIPDLTYEDFIERYRRFYHPSNAYFYLDGDIPLGKTLGMIEEYLDGYDSLNGLPEITMQEPAVRDEVCRYEVSDEDGKAMIVLGRICGTWADRRRLLALGVLTEQLADSNESPLKRAVLSSGLAEDMEMYVSDGIAQPYLMIVLRGVTPCLPDEVRPEDAAPGTAAYEEGIRRAGDRLLGIIRETAERTAADGIAARDLEASVNQLDFRFRQYPEPQGLYRANAVFNSWLYGGDPALYLKTSEAIAELREDAAQGRISALAEEYLADTAGLTRLTLIPSTELGEESAAEEAERIRRIISSMSAEEKEALREMNRDLARWQETPDSEEALASIPKLDPADISDTPELIATSVTEKDGVTILHHPVPTSGIVYINAYFPLTDLSYEELPAAALVTELYKELPTENYSVTDLQTEIRMHVGSISFGVDVNSADGDREHCVPCLRGRAAVLRENLSYAEDLLIEIMTRTRFGEREMIRELVRQIDEEGRRYAVSSGHRLAIYAARSHYSARDAAAEALNGYTFIQYMHEMNSGFDSRIDDFISFAESVTERAVVRAGACVTVTSSEETDMSRLVSMLPEGSERPACARYESVLPSRLGLMLPAAVSYSAAACDLSEAGMSMKGSMTVAANILSLAYLWNEIRVRGGAYGTAVSAGRTGTYFCYSYRDPSPARSLGIYASIPEFIDTLRDMSREDLGGFIISTVAQTEPLISPAARGRAADDFWFSGFTDEDRIRMRREILSATAEDLISWKDAFVMLAEAGSVCVAGPKAALETVPDLDIRTV